MKKGFLLLCFCCIAHLFFAQAPSTDSIEQLKLVFAGDIMGHGPQIKAAEVVPNKSYNYEPAFRYVQPILENADLAIGNLELTLPGQAPYKGYPMFRSPDDLARDLRFAGFDVLVTANNHSNDSGGKGVARTIDVLREWGFYQTGTFKDTLEKQVYSPLIIYKNNFKIALLNYTYGTNGIPTTPPVIVNLMQESLIASEIEQAKMFQPDIIIVFIHWGNEYQLNESPQQQALAKKIHEWGADLIVGAHPHVVQPIKQSVSAAQKKQLVAYSLGNFISGQVQPNTDGGIMLEVVLQKNKFTQQTSIGNHRYILVWRYISRDEKGKETYQTIPVTMFEQGAYDDWKMPEKAKAALATFAKRMRSHLAKWGAAEQVMTLEKNSPQAR